MSTSLLGFMLQGTCINQKNRSSKIGKPWETAKPTSLSSVTSLSMIRRTHRIREWFGQHLETFGRSMSGHSLQKNIPMHIIKCALDTNTKYRYNTVPVLGCFSVAY